jgi:hypothetical protein
MSRDAVLGRFCRAAAPGVKIGGVWGRQEELYGDRTYDAEVLREELRDRDIKPKLAKRRRPHASVLGNFRWVVESS